MRANFANTTGSSQVGRMSYQNGPSGVHMRLCGVGLPLRCKSAGPNRLGGENAEQVKVCGLLIVEHAHLVPGARGGIEDLEPIGSLDQAHGAVDLFANGVGGRRYRREACEFREDPLGCLAPELGTSAGGRARASGGPAADAAQGARWAPPAPRLPAGSARPAAARSVAARSVAARPAAARSVAA